MRREILQISDLIGEEISGIGFVVDYIEVYFNGPILRILTNLKIITLGAEFAFPELGSRDALCEVICSTVVSVNLEERKFLKITTSNSIELVVPLIPHDLSQAEVMHFVPKMNGPIQIW